MLPSPSPLRSYGSGASLPSLSPSVLSPTGAASSFASTLTSTSSDDSSPPLPHLSPLSPTTMADDDFVNALDPSHLRYARRWLSISSPSQLQQQRETQRLHLQKLHSMPVLVAPTSAVDFSRHDVSLLHQLLAFAAEETAKRSAGLPDSNYTALTCVPTASLIHSIQSRRRESAASQSSTHRSHQRSFGGGPGSGLSISTGKTSRTSYDRLPPVNGLAPLSPHTPASPSSASSYASAVQPSSPRHSASPSLSSAFSSSAASLPFLQDSVLRPVGDATIGGERHAVLAGHIAYPLHWCPALHLSPFHIDAGQLSEVEVIQWCVSAFGAQVVTESAKARLLALESARWAAFLAPFASDEYVSLIGRFLALFVILDDQLIEQAVQLRLTAKQLSPYADVWRYAADRREGRTQASHECGERIRALAMRLQLPLLERSFEAIWLLSDAFAARAADAAWCARFAQAWAEYVELGIREAIAADAINTAAVNCPAGEALPPIRIPLTRYDHPAVHAAAAAVGQGHRLQGMAVLEVLGRQRIASIGLPMMVLLLERACGLSLSSIDSLLTPATHILALIPALVNELVGLARDLREGDTLIATNFSLVQRRIFHCSLAQSIEFTLALHDQAVSAFDVCCQHMLAHPSASSPALQPRLAVYLDRLRQCVRGYAQWHHHAARYKSVMAVDTTERAVFIFPVHDGHSQAQKEAAIQDTLKQYQAHADTNSKK